VKPKKISQKQKRDPLDKMGLMAAEAGLIGSLALVIYVGRNNPSYLLQAMFVLWVSAPFAALLVAHVQAKRWSIGARRTLCWLSLVVTVLSLALYGLVALHPPRTKTGLAFVMVPPLSWLLFAFAAIVSSLRTRRV
jgi:pheromone shutdown protein TraB